MNRALIAVLRIGVALLWMQNAAWKDPPGFGALRTLDTAAELFPCA